MTTEEINQRVQQARSLHSEGYNCAQSVALAYADIMPMERDVLTAVTSTFGRGLSQLREVCGCVSAMAMVAPFIGSPNAVKLTQQLAAQFKAENGDIVCRRLLGLEGPLPDGKVKKPCNDYVAIAARLLGEALTQNGR